MAPAVETALRRVPGPTLALASASRRCGRELCDRRRVKAVVRVAPAGECFTPEPAAPVALPLFDRSASAAGRRTDAEEAVVTDAIGAGRELQSLAGARKEGLTSL